ncbi:TPA: hypothetical protein ACS9RQ_005395, partial [Klebsiella pneumoniae]
SNADGVDIKISNDEGKSSNVYIKNGSSGIMDVEEFSGKESTIEILKHEYSACDSIKITAK